MSTNTCKLKMNAIPVVQIRKHEEALTKSRNLLNNAEFINPGSIATRSYSDFLHSRTFRILQNPVIGVEPRRLQVFLLPSFVVKNLYQLHGKSSFWRIKGRWNRANIERMLRTPWKLYRKMGSSA